MSLSHSPERVIFQGGPRDGEEVGMEGVFYIMTDKIRVLLNRLCGMDE